MHEKKNTYLLKLELLRNSLKSWVIIIDLLAAPIFRDFILNFNE